MWLQSQSIAIDGSQTDVETMFSSRISCTPEFSAMNEHSVPVVAILNLRREEKVLTLELQGTDLAIGEERLKCEYQKE